MPLLLLLLLLLLLVDALLPSLLIGAMRPMYFCWSCIVASDASRLAKVFESCVSWFVRIWLRSLMRVWYIVIESCNVLLASVKLPVLGSVIALRAFWADAANPVLVVVKKLATPDGFVSKALCSVAWFNDS